jgi:hypothetical protein
MGHHDFLALTKQRAESPALSPRSPGVTLRKGYESYICTSLETISVYQVNSNLHVYLYNLYLSPWGSFANRHSCDRRFFVNDILDSGSLIYFTHSSFVVKWSISPWRKDSGRSPFSSIFIAPQSAGCFLIVQKGTLVKWGAIKSFSAEDIHGAVHALVHLVSARQLNPNLNQVFF